METFTTTANLRDHLQALAGQPVDALFHTAAVSDFTVGKVWRRAPRGGLTEVHAGKLPTREGTLLAELAPTPKIIADLREWFPHAWLVGWKYEVEGGQRRGDSTGGTANRQTAARMRASRMGRPTARVSGW